MKHVSQNDFRNMKWPSMTLKVIDIIAIRKATYDILLVFDCKYMYISYVCIYLSKPAKQVWYWALRVYWDQFRVYVCVYVIKLLPNHWTDLHKNYTSK